MPAAIRDGWYFTGDTGLIGRRRRPFRHRPRRRLIITGGENVSPVEIESCLSLHPAVAEVAVAGLPDERWGKIVCAFVKRARGGGGRASSTPFAAAPGLPISSARAATCSSPKFRNRRSVNCCAASSSPANIATRSLTDTLKQDTKRHEHSDDFRRHASRQARRLPRRDRCRSASAPT